MEFKFDSEVYSKIKKQRRRRVWKRVLSAMMCLVVFCTTYVLILPAITKETDVFCGIEEHTHRFMTDENI
jgi:cytochrome c-type biogenesis protein CcmE